MRKHKGFTLVEILIVVVILGILAAIVIPQFSDASTQSKLSSSQSSLQSLRSQISLYKIQHNDYPPTLETFADEMEKKTDADRTVSATGLYGPYVQKVPMNPWNNQRGVGDEPGATIGWIYDEDTGAIYLSTDGVPEGETLTALETAGAVAP